MKTAIGIVALLVVIGGGYWWWQARSSAMPALSDDGTSIAQDAIDDAQGGDSNAPMIPASTTPQSDAGAPMSATVTYDGTSFSPQTVTIKQGGTVTFTDTNGTMWVASDPHPVHTGYDGTSRSEHCAAGYSGAAPFDQCGTGASYSFAFDKVGSWGYHDHVNHAAIGTIVVVQ